MSFKENDWYARLLHCAKQNISYIRNNWNDPAKKTLIPTTVSEFKSNLSTDFFSLSVPLSISLLNSLFINSIYLAKQVC